MLKKVCFIFLLISASVCVSLMSSTYSRYVADTTGNIDISFAKWQILVNDSDIISQKDSTISFTPVMVENENVAANTFAPASEGYIDIEIDPTNVEVSFNYKIDLSVDSKEVTDLKITKYAIAETDYIETEEDLEFIEENVNSITNDMIFDNNAKEFKFNKFIVRVYFEWVEGENETMDDEADSLVGNAAATSDLTFKVNANITFEQIIN